MPEIRPDNDVVTRITTDAGCRRALFVPGVPAPHC
jgi:hypothetical protein